MTRGSRNSSSLVDVLLAVKRIIGIVAVLGVFYLVVPWGLIRVLASGEEVTPDVFAMAISEWAFGLADNILLIVLLLFVAVLTYGPQALDLVAGPNEQRRY